MAKQLLVILLIIGFIGLAQAEQNSAYGRLSDDQKIMWERLLLQGNPEFLPKNADYYLSNTDSPDLAREFDLVSAYLHGVAPYTGQPDQAPWCRFPARFAFVAKALDGKLVLPEAYRACNLALPLLDENLNATLIKVLEPQDTGRALFHVGLVIEGRRFYNGTALSMEVGFGPRDGGGMSGLQRRNEAVMLLGSFFGDGHASVQQNVLPGHMAYDAAAVQAYRVNLMPEQIYMMSLLAYETTHADLPYNLLRANCQTYMQGVFTAIVPVESIQKRWFFDYFPNYMQQANGSANNFGAKLFEPLFYRGLPRSELRQIAKSLDWREAGVLQSFLDEAVLPADILTGQYSSSLKEGLVKAAEISLDKLILSPEVQELRDQFLRTAQQYEVQAESPVFSSYVDDVPVFQSPSPSVQRFGISNYDGSGRVSFGFDIFNTTADSLAADKPYGFVLGRFDLQASNDGISFDRFLFAQENKVGSGCCGEALYNLSFKKLRRVSLDVVNYPERIAIPEWRLDPDLEVNISQGFGTVNAQGFSVQIMPEASFLTYADMLDISVDHRIGWAAGEFAVSVGGVLRLYGPDVRRMRPEKSVAMNYKVANDSYGSIGYKFFEHGDDVLEVSYVFAF